MLSYMKLNFNSNPANGTAYAIALFQHNQPEKEIRAVLKKMRDAGSTILPELRIMEYSLDRKSGKDTYEKVMNHLLTNPDTPLWPFKNALNEVRSQLDVKNPARIKNFYTKLKKLAMVLPPDKAGMERVQWCMQERTKLEGLVPECLGMQIKRN